MYSVEIIADDLTGAMDTAQGFAARGYRTNVLVDPTAGTTTAGLDKDTAVLSINTDSRYEEKFQAVDSVAETVTSFSAQTIYKKVDSTLRGNFVAEVDAALTRSEADVALVAPAFPPMGRTTEDDIHYVNGTPVTETEYGDDGKGPTSSALTELFASLERPVESVSLQTVDAGKDRVASVINNVIGRHERAPVLACDARNDDHLAAVGEAGAAFDTLYVGSGGLAKHIPISQTDDGKPSLPDLSSGAALGVVGSVSATTLMQLDHVSDEAIVELDGDPLLRGDDIDGAMEQAVRRLQNDQPVVLTAATDDGAVDRTIAAGRDLELALADVRERVARGLAETATEILQIETPSGLLLTGGDIAVAVIRALGATAVTLTGEEVEAGIPIGVFADGSTAGMPLITKAGGFGSEETIVNCLDTLTSTDA
ncbi:four-carbon acid sugar kinase family protein [Halomicrococcus sp. NG-SE-24]|uniref:four-carbon acid sugar kinase family protein n=1 Tax=Halomicrococcus sp. NG-SE-24 TaxID=3436928 RepID=UPI003D97B0F1